MKSVLDIFNASTHAMKQYDHMDLGLMYQQYMSGLAHLLHMASLGHNELNAIP